MIKSVIGILKKSDKKLISEIEQNNATGGKASTQLYNRYKPYGYGVLNNKGIYQDDARGIYQEVFAEILFNIQRSKLVLKSSFKNYLARAISNRANTWIKRKTTERERNLLLEKGDFETLAQSDEPELALSNQEIMKLVIGIFADLAGKEELKTKSLEEFFVNESYKEVECIHIYILLAQKYDWEDIATEVNRSKQGAKNKRARCYEDLKKELNEKYPYHQKILSSIFKKLKPNNE